MQTRFFARLALGTLGIVLAGCGSTRTIVITKPGQSGSSLSKNGTATFQQTCPVSAGAVTDDSHWKESAPYLISISRATILSISGRVGQFEGHHATEPRFVPCAVAQSVAYQGMKAWHYSWAHGDGSMDAGWTGAGTGPSFGSFHCTGYQAKPGSYSETCTHQADEHAGPIVVKFTIATATAATTPRLAAPPEVYFEGAVTPARQRPGTLPLTVDGTLYVSAAQWTTWGGQTATGNGVAHYHGCTPTCGQSPVREAFVAIRLSGIRTCAGRRYYSAVTLTLNSGQLLSKDFLQRSWSPC